MLRAQHGWMGSRALLLIAASLLVATMAKDTIRVESMGFSDDRVCTVLLHTMQGPTLGMTTYIQYSSGEGCSQLQRILSATRSYQHCVVAMNHNGYSSLCDLVFVSENRVG